MNFKIPNGHRNNSYRNEPTYLPPGHSTKSSVRRQKFHALMGEMDANMAAPAIFFSTFYTSFTALPSIAGLNSHRRSKLRREN